MKQLRQAEGFRSYKLELWNYGWVGKNKIVEPSSEKNKIVELSSETPPPEIFREQNLPCGDYWINAKSSDRTARLTLVKILPLLVARVSSVLPYSQANDTSIKRFTLELTLNSEAESSRGCDRAIPNSTVE